MKRKRNSWTSAHDLKSDMIYINSSSFPSSCYVLVNKQILHLLPVLLPCLRTVTVRNTKPNDYFNLFFFKPPLLHFFAILLSQLILLWMITEKPAHWRARTESMDFMEETVFSQVETVEVSCSCASLTLA